MTEQALDKKTLITELTKSAHGKLEEYVPVGARAASEDPDFFAHLVSYNHLHGQIRDAKVALPILALASKADDVYRENALAHLADLRPRDLAKALLPTRRPATEPKKVKKGEKREPVAMLDVPPFMQTAKAPTRLLRRLVTRYLRDMEADRRSFEYAAVLHARVLADLYAHFHVSRPAWVGSILFHGEKGQSKNLPPGIFEVIRRLHLMPIEEAAGTIVKYKIPFLVARGALGKKASEPDTVLALMKAMSPTELVTNVKWLEKLGVKTNPALRAAFEQALGKAATAKTPKATLKTTKAAEVFADDEVLTSKLQVLQEKQLDTLGGVDGDWLVLGDKSGSMATAIELARQVAALLTRMVKGKVHLVFFDTSPRYLDATGKTLEELTAITRGVSAVGGTSIGCGLQALLDKKIAVEGIAIVSDGGENTSPYFGPVYQQYCEKLDCTPTVYLYQTDGESDRLFTSYCASVNLDVQRFDLRGQSVDHYSLPNLAATMRVQRYSLIEEILATPLRTLDEVLDSTKGMAVLPKAAERLVIV